jgi:hypothetical protein
MGRLTVEERRRLVLAQRQTAGKILAGLRSDPLARHDGAPRRRRRWLPTAAIIAALLSSGWLAYHAMEFHVPTSIVETLLPRLG